MNATSFLFIAIVISLLIGLYNLITMTKMLHGMWWILTHVMVVGKKDQQDPEFTQIKKMFGITDKEVHGKKD